MCQYIEPVKVDKADDYYSQCFPYQIYVDQYGFQYAKLKVLEHCVYHMVKKTV